MLCKYCLKPILECQKQDLLLLKPFDKRFKESWMTDTRVTKRYHRAVEYVVGAVDKENNMTYMIQNVRVVNTITHEVLSDFDKGLTIRQYIDIALTLPMCVWGDDESDLKRHQKELNRLNIDALPIETEYHKLLNRIDVL